MADTTAFRLTSLSIPTTLDLSSGTARLSISGTLAGNSADIRQVLVQFDKNITYGAYSSSSTTSSFLGIYGYLDSWSDGSSSDSWSVLSTNQNGTYRVTGVTLTDVMGNSTVYSPAQLQALGINTAIEVSGAKPDTKAPELTSLSIPDKIDLSKGMAALAISGTATDDNAGVNQVTLWFDKPIAYSDGAADAANAYSFLGMYGIRNTWSDGASSETWNILPTNQNGTYRVVRATVTDLQGNAIDYSAAQLQKLGINTAIEITGAKPDTTPPALTSLSIPDRIDLSKGAAAFSISATATDDNAGVKDVAVWLDKNISYSYGSSTYSSTISLLYLSGGGKSWSDGNSESWNLLAGNQNGTYHVTRVSVTDLQGNRVDYTPAQLQALGVNTAIRVTGAGSDATAPTVVKFTPADQATGVWRYANVVVEFDEAIERGKGTIVLKDGAGKVVESFDAATSTRLAIDGTKLVVNPVIDLAPDTGYTLEFGKGTIEDLAGNQYLGSSNYHFTVGLLQQAFQIASVAVDGLTARLTFDADVPGGAAALDFRLGVDGWHEVDNDAALAWRTAGLDDRLLAEVLLSRLPVTGAPVDAYPFSTLFKSGETVDLQQLHALRFTPAGNASGVGIKSDIEIVFDRAIQRGAGVIVLKDAQGGVVERFDIASSKQVGIIGSTLVIDPAADFGYNKGYTLELAAGVVVDRAGNQYAGSTGYHFTTAATADTTAPAVVKFTPASGATAVRHYDDIVVEFSETIQRGNGSIVLKDAAGKIVETIDAATSPRLAIDGSKLVVDPVTDLAPGAAYTVVFGKDAVQDLAGNPYAGAADYRFTVRPQQETFKIVGSYVDRDTVHLSFDADLPGGLGMLDFKYGDHGWYNADGGSLAEWRAAGLDVDLLAQRLLARLPSTGLASGTWNFIGLFAVGETIGLHDGDIRAGGSDADTLAGGAGNDHLYGHGGNDALAGGDGADWLFGGDGNDTLSGGAGNDSLSGGAGDDRLDGGEGNDTLDGGAGNDAMADFGGDNLVAAGAGDDKVEVGNGRNWVSGGSGNDNLSLRNGSGILYGEDGDDVLSVTFDKAMPSGSGDIVLSGGAGNDTFRVAFQGAGSGSVNAAGGEGRDVFVLGAGSPYTVKDFQAGKGGDAIRLGELIGQVDQDHNPFASGHLNLVQQGSATLVTYDRDGAAGGAQPVALLVLEGVKAAALTAENIVEGVDPQQQPAAASGPAPAPSTPAASTPVQPAPAAPPVAAPVPAPAEPGQTLFAAAGGGLLEGGRGDDILHGAQGNDILVGGAGNDTLDGGAGLDTARYAGARANYTVTRDAGGAHVVDRVGSDGTDVLAGIERVQFADGWLALDVDGVAGQAYRIYRAAFDRAPDLGGLGYWLASMESGQSLRQVATQFLASAEFAGLYGTAPSNADIVGKLYQNILHRAPEQAGFDYWLGILDGRKSDLAGVLSNFSESAENVQAVAEVVANGIAYQPWGA